MMPTRRRGIHAANPPLILTQFIIGAALDAFMIRLVLIPIITATRVIRGLTERTHLRTR